MGDGRKGMEWNGLERNGMEEWVTLIADAGISKN